MVLLLANALGRRRLSGLLEGRALGRDHSYSI